MSLKKISRGLILLAFMTFLFYLGLILVNWINQSTTLNLSDVIVNGNRLLETDEVLSLISVKQEQNITNIDLLEIQKSIESHHYIEMAFVSRKFPSTLQINIVEREPVALISGSELFAVDQNGILLPRTKPQALSGLPVITGIEGFKEIPGTKIDSDRIVEAIGLFNIIRTVDKKLYQNLSEIRFNSRKGFLAYFNDARFPAYFGFENFYENTQKLQAFFQRIHEEDRYNKLKYIDLRFHEQVVAKFK